MACKDAWSNGGHAVENGPDSISESKGRICLELVVSDVERKIC